MLINIQYTEKLIARWESWWNSWPEVGTSLSIHHQQSGSTAHSWKHSTAQLSSHYWRRWCSNRAHWFQIDPTNGQTAGILFHYLSLEHSLTADHVFSDGTTESHTGSFTALIFNTIILLLLFFNYGLLINLSYFMLYSVLKLKWWVFYHCK